MKRVVAGVAMCCALVACAPSPPPGYVDANRDPAGTTGSGSDLGIPQTSGDAPEQLTVDYPGPRRSQDAIVPADILVSAQQTLSDEVVGAIGALDGVSASSVLSVGQVAIESTVYTVAAVDIASYRRFTGSSSADLDEQWRRVAGGEIAASADLRRRLPVDDEGYLRLGADSRAMRLHVGAWAPQAEQIDLVVNTAVGEQLGIVERNALVLSTGLTAPDTLRQPLTRLLGPRASVQNLDAVARFGLDPDAYQTAVLVGSFADAVGVFTYTPIGGGRIAPDPDWVREHITTETVPILGSVTCNKAIFPQLRAALTEIVQQGLADEIHPEQYAGCYYPRFIAGSSTLSNHSFGLALDLNVPGNQRGTVGEIDRGVVAIFKRWGFGWGGDWRWTDPMHFELAQIVRPG
ncbi:M15 family metallopeptidase [Nocardioides sp. R-C-SC26]|uniref:M15 family metallopeptidase n=1 Tax=Nocardioides sp. R-C-SC26 TaxID=2870414 RepID=UPI001E63D293|nr:M15 family metallopeptidase [Nocardioides sp. R-C-SC26]